MVFSTPCDHCRKGTLIKEINKLSIDIKCSKCGRGWHIPLTPPSLSPCEDPRFQPPEPQAVRIPRDVDPDLDRDEFIEDPEEPEEDEAF